MFQHAEDVFIVKLNVIFNKIIHFNATVVGLLKYIYTEQFIDYSLSDSVTHSWLRTVDMLNAKLHEFSDPNSLSS